MGNNRHQNNKEQNKKKQNQQNQNANRQEFGEEVNFKLNQSNRKQNNNR